jgi:hypothetical protein
MTTKKTHLGKFYVKFTVEHSGQSHDCGLIRSQQDNELLEGIRIPKDAQGLSWLFRPKDPLFHCLVGFSSNAEPDFTPDSDPTNWHYCWERLAAVQELQQLDPRGGWLFATILQSSQKQTRDFPIQVVDPRISVPSHTQVVTYINPLSESYRLYYQFV